MKINATLLAKIAKGLRKTILVAALLGAGISQALEANTVAFGMQADKSEKKAQKEKMKVENQNTRATEKAQSKNAAKTKADGTPDKRYKENKKLKKDGTPDKRFKDNNGK